MIPISLPVICDLTFDPMRELSYLLWQHVMIIDYWLYFVPLLSSHALLLLLFPRPAFGCAAGHSGRRCRRHSELIMSHPATNPHLMAAGDPGCRPSAGPWPASCSAVVCGRFEPPIMTDLTRSIFYAKKN
jgi:hypothetical protein